MRRLLIERGRRANLLVPAMVIATAAISASSGILTLFTVDIASTFNVSVGVASQLATINYAAEFFFSLLMGFLAVRFKYKPLIMVGVLLVIVSAVGSFLAPGFVTMQIFFAMEGIGSVIVSVISLTLFGDVFAPEKRAKAVSYLVVTLSVMALIGNPWAGFIANVAGWRYIFVLQMLPLSVAGLTLAFFAVPSRPHNPVATVKRASHVESFRQILTDKSATACLAGNILNTAGLQVGIFGIAFYRQRFSVSVDFTVVLSLALTVLFIIGNFIAGRLMNRFDAKPIVVTSTLLTGVFTITFFLIPNLLGALFFDFLHVWFAAVAAPAYLCLALAQVPNYRGTMMSLNRATESFAKTVGPVMGGTLLVLTNGFYGAVGLALGSMSVVSSSILFFLARNSSKHDFRLRGSREI